MSSHFSLRWMCLLVVALAAVPASAEDVAQYREFPLGSTVMSVSDITGSRASDLKTVHARPALLQELAWSPRYSARGATPDVDPVREIVFTFYNDQLSRIAVHYDRARTAGLTHADMVRALTQVYGPPLVPTSRVAGRGPMAPADVVTPIAQWESGDDTIVSLHWSDYRAGFGLIVMSQRLDDLARSASVTAVALDVREAPMREAARQKKEADDRQAADDKTRATNIGAFRP